MSDTNKFYQDLNFTGVVDIENSYQPIGLLTEDRRRHVYIVGKSGMGKSTLMENMVMQDILAGKGVAYIDPLGDSAENIISRIPTHRIPDVIYFDPADTQYPIGINILENTDPEQTFLISSNILATMQKIWAGMWSARMEYIMLNTILALMEVPGNSLLGLQKMFLESDFRKYISDKCQNITVKKFWEEEFPRFSSNYANEAVAAIQNKVGQFFANEMIRNIIGAQHNSLNFREIMDTGKIFIANLAKGKIGETNSILLGGIILSQIEIATMSRADTAESQRRDFFLYMDEFQDLINPSFETLLSQARKYRLNLTFANQYLDQVSRISDTDILKAIFGNVGSIIALQTSVEDSEVLSKELPPTPPEYFPKLNQGQAYAKLYVQGDTLDSIFISTFPPMYDEFLGSRQAVIENTRNRHTTHISQARKQISKYLLESKILNANGKETKLSLKRKRNRHKNNKTKSLKGLEKSETKII